MKREIILSYSLMKLRVWELGGGHLINLKTSSLLEVIKGNFQ